MIFQATWQQVLDGTKTQTRRIMQDGEKPLVDIGNFVDVATDKNGRVKWVVDKTYAVQPARGKTSIARIKINKIRYELLHGIIKNDVIAEGIYREVVGVDEYGFEQSYYSHGLWAQMYFNPFDAYRTLWNSVHTKKGERWIDNPTV